MKLAEPATDHTMSTAPPSIDGTDSMLTGDAVTRLDFLTVLRISGRDALAFLQGQLTADVGEVDASTSRLTAWCSPKGRVLALFRLLADPDGGYRVVCERWFTGALLARLRMFVLRSEVRIEDASDALGVAGVAGMRALPERLAGWARTAAVDDAAGFEEVTITRVPGCRPRFLIIGSHARVGSIVSAAAEGDMRTAAPGAWRRADICTGVARIDAEASDRFLPQMLNLDQFRAVSFEKGCYVGQEIVARAQHLGRVKRRAWMGRTAATVAANDPIVETSGTTASKVGEVVAAEPHPDGGSVATVVLNVDCAHSETLRVGRSDGPPVRIPAPDAMEPPD